MSMEDIPNDSVYEILTRVSLSSIDVCRRVCREWRRITYKPEFALVHGQRTGTVSGCFIQDLQHNHYSSTFVSLYQSPVVPLMSLDFLPEEVKIEASSIHGLLCCVSCQRWRNQLRYYVCKPTTREWWRIPNPRIRYRTKMTAMVVRPQTKDSMEYYYKIIRFSEPRHTRNYMRCEVFDSRVGAWRRCNDVINLPPGSSPPIINYDEEGVWINGAIHWLSRDGRHIFAFDVETEAWRMIPLPLEDNWADEDNYWAHNDHVAECEGKLWLLRVAREESIIGIWVMKDYWQEEIWEGKGVVSLETINTDHRCSSLMVLYTTPLVALMREFYMVMWYDFKSGKLTKVRVNHPSPREVFRFRSDFIPCNMNRRCG